MSPAAKINNAASVHQRLLNVSHAHGDEFNRVCIRYASERLLYRLSVSEYANHFILKGAMLFAVWSDSPHRATRDVDFLAVGSADADQLQKVFKALCVQTVTDDGLSFDPESIQIQVIREPETYGGFRVRLNSYLGKMRILVQIDIGFGNVVTPEVQIIEYPAILDSPCPKLQAYPPETVIAEKFHALVKLGMANSRMKDFYDLYVMSQLYHFNSTLLLKAICATFERRKTEMPVALPLALTRRFVEDKTKAMQWRAYLEKSDLQDAPRDFSHVIETLRIFFSKIVSFGQ